MLEGVRLVAEAISAGVSLRLALFDAEQLAATAGGQDVLDRVAGQPSSYPASARAISAAADTVTPQGVVAVAAWPELAPRPGLILVLDGVQDPGNVGTLLRSAEAAGVGQALCLPGTADVYSPKVVRAAMGAHFYLPIQVDLDWGTATTLLSTTPHIYVADAQANMAYYRVDWRQPSALIIGSEAHGVSAAGRAIATQPIAIPMVGRTESLNAGVAGSVIMFEALRQQSE